MGDFYLHGLLYLERHVDSASLVVLSVARSLTFPPLPRASLTPARPQQLRPGGTHQDGSSPACEPDRSQRVQTGAGDEELSSLPAAFKCGDTCYDTHTHTHLLSPTH